MNSILSKEEYRKYIIRVIKNEYDYDLIPNAELNEIDDLIEERDKEVNNLMNNESFDKIYNKYVEFMNNRVDNDIINVIGKVSK